MQAKKRFPAAVRALSLALVVGALPVTANAWYGAPGWGGPGWGGPGWGGPGWGGPGWGAPAWGGPWGGPGWGAPYWGGPYAGPYWGGPWAMPEFATGHPSMSPPSVEEFMRDPMGQTATPPAKKEAAPK